MYVHHCLDSDCFQCMQIQIDGGCKAQTNCQQVNGSSAVQQNNGVTTSNGQLRQG